MNKTLVTAFEDISRELNMAEMFRKDIKALYERIEKKDIEIDQTKKDYEGLLDEVVNLREIVEEKKDKIKDLEKSLHGSREMVSALTEKTQNLLAENQKRLKRIIEQNKKIHNLINENVKTEEDINNYYGTRVAISQIIDRSIIDASCVDEFKRYVDNMQYMLKDDFKMLLDNFPDTDIKIRLEISPKNEK